jgi:hypothetical protein
MRWLFLLILPALLSLTTSPAASAVSNEPRTVVSGGELPYSIRFTAADEDAFRRRINYPPVYERSTPEPEGASYTLTSSYWEPVVQSERRNWEPVEAEALYYPESGLVMARQDGEDVWLTLGVRQRAIIDRYIRLGEAGRLGPEPGLLDVVRAAAEDELVGVQVGGKLLDTREVAIFWHTVGPAEQRTNGGEEHQLGISRYILSPRPDDIWVIFTLPEGRALSLVYESQAGRFLDVFEPDSYVMSANALENALGNGEAFRPLEVPQQASRGSPVWWFVMVGGGLGMLATAVWLRRRLA